MENQTRKQPKYYDLSEVEKFLRRYEKWYNAQNGIQTADDEDEDSGSNPGTPPPPPPGSHP